MNNFGFISFSHIKCEEDCFLYLRKEYGFMTLHDERRHNASCDKEAFTKIVVPKENGYYKIEGNGFSKIENPFEEIPEEEVTSGKGEPFYLRVEWAEPTPITYHDPDERHGMFRDAYSAYHD